MSKTVTSVSLDQDLHERLQEDEHVNASGLFNSFLREYYSTKSVDGVDFRIREVDRRLDEATDRVDRLEEEKQRLKEQKEERQQMRGESLEDKLMLLDTIPNHKLDKDNPAVINHASDLCMPPRELAEEARNHRPNG